MKFHELAIGSRFVFAGKRCIKTNAVMASEVETGKPVFMKRSSEVQPEDEVGQQTQSVLNQAQQLVHDALVAYRQACLETLKEEMPDIDPQRLSILNEKLEQSRIDIFRQVTENLR
jgi:hypothetical protein